MAADGPGHPGDSPIWGDAQVARDRPMDLAPVANPGPGHGRWRRGAVHPGRAGVRHRPAAVVQRGIWLDPAGPDGTAHGDRRDSRGGGPAPPPAEPGLSRTGRGWPHRWPSTALPAGPGRPRRAGADAAVLAGGP